MNSFANQANENQTISRAQDIRTQLDVTYGAITLMSVVVDGIGTNRSFGQAYSVSDPSALYSLTASIPLVQDEVRESIENSLSNYNSVFKILAYPWVSLRESDRVIARHISDVEKAVASLLEWGLIDERWSDTGMIPGLSPGFGDVVTFVRPTKEVLNLLERINQEESGVSLDQSWRSDQP